MPGPKGLQGLPLTRTRVPVWQVKKKQAREVHPIPTQGLDPRAHTPDHVGKASGRAGRTCIYEKPQDSSADKKGRGPGNRIHTNHKVGAHVTGSEPIRKQARETQPALASGTQLAQLPSVGDTGNSPPLGYLTPRSLSSCFSAHPPAGRSPPGHPSPAHLPSGLSSALPWPQPWNGPCTCTQGQLPFRGPVHAGINRKDVICGTSLNPHWDPSHILQAGGWVQKCRAHTALRQQVRIQTLADTEPDDSQPNRFRLMVPTARDPEVERHHLVRS